MVNYFLRCVVSTIDYHIKELDIALRSDDPSHLIPFIYKGTKSILDIGCGIGQTLIAMNPPSGKICVGVDVDFEALSYGNKLGHEIHYVNCKGEQLPFRDDAFDMIFSRVALPYMNIPVAIKEITRLLEPGGRLWVVLHPFSMLSKDVKRSIMSADAKDCLYRLYVLINGLSLHFLSRQFQYPLKNCRCESFQTRRGIERLLLKWGYTDLQFTTGKFFILQARKGNK